MGEVIEFVKGGRKPSKGSCGLYTQLHGCIASVSALADATNEIASGNFIETETK